MTQNAKKRPYMPPRIETSEPFERLALGCNGTSGGRKKFPPASCTTSAAS